MSAAKTNALRKVHFAGICGTAMGSLAAALRDSGVEVTGSDDNVYPPMSTFLESKGVTISKGFRAENIPSDADFVVIGNAMSRGNPEVEAVLNRKPTREKAGGRYVMKLTFDLQIDNTATADTIAGSPFVVFAL